MVEESLITAKNTIDIVIPIVLALITWLLSRIKNPDYGKKDWKCKEKRSSFGTYTIFLIFIFALPLIAYLFSVVFQKIYIDPILDLFIKNKTVLANVIEIYFVISTILIYYITYVITKKIELFFVPKNIKTVTMCILKIIIYCPIILSFVASMKISMHMDILCYSNSLTVSILVFQIVGMIFLDDGKKYRNKKMKIVMNDGSSISANVENVCKKGKWLRILEQEIPRKEKLVVFDDIKCIEYFD